MTAAFQASLLDLAEEVEPGPLAGTVQRTELTDGAWVDVRTAWIGGADALFERLVEIVPWRAERRPMYDRVVDVPRLLCFYDEGVALPDPALVAMKDALDAHYGAELGEPFRTAGLCLYRDGRDSVAWHGDRIGRGNTEDTMVAIVSLGAPRALLLRPNGGNADGSVRGRSAAAPHEIADAISRGPRARPFGPAMLTPPSPRGASALRHELGHGDLLVMGGSCQRTWEHAVPKTAKPVGPRISIQFRTRGVR